MAECAATRAARLDSRLGRVHFSADGFQRLEQEDGNVIRAILGISSAAAFGAVALMGASPAFAVFHGHAHGAGMPAAALPELHGLGFALATAALHGIGLLAGTLAVMARDGLPASLARAGGGALAAAGLVLAVL
jgi:urease accessory protein